MCQLSYNALDPIFMIVFICRWCRCVASIVEWWYAFFWWIVRSGAQFLELPLHWICLANCLQIHQIIKFPKTENSILSLIPIFCYHLSCLFVGPHQHHCWSADWFNTIASGFFVVLCSRGIYMVDFSKISKEWWNSGAVRNAFSKKILTSPKMEFLRARKKRFFASENHCRVRIPRELKILPVPVVNFPTGKQGPSEGNRHIGKIEEKNWVLLHQNPENSSFRRGKERQRMVFEKNFESQDLFYSAVSNALTRSFFTCIFTSIPRHY